LRAFFFSKKFSKNARFSLLPWLLSENNKFLSRSNHETQNQFNQEACPGGVFNCKAINIRERLLRFLLGDMHKVTVLIPGDNVGEILICKSGEKLNEKSQTKTDANL